MIQKISACVILILVLTSCTKYPYEPEIRKFYHDNAKMSINIDDVIIDSAVSPEQAMPHIERKFSRTKERLIAGYREKYEHLNKTNASSEALTRSRLRLDSANKGLFSLSEYEVQYFNDLLSGKYRYEQVRLSYRLPGGSVKQNQVFVARISARDTTLQMTDRDLKDYLTR